MESINCPKYAMLIPQWETCEVCIYKKGENKAEEVEGKIINISCNYYNK
jgi:hypothetical protein